MNLRRPSGAEFSARCEQPTPMGVSLAGFGRGIDNAHIDILLSPLFRATTEDAVRKLLREDVRAGNHRAPAPLVRSADLIAFRDAYAALCETAFEGYASRPSVESCFLLQLALLKFLLQTVNRECLRLHEALKDTLHTGGSRSSGQSVVLHEQLIALTQHRNGISHRVLQLLFSEVRTLETRHLKNLRIKVLREPWPFPEAAWFNPVLLIPDPGDLEVLAREYPIAALGEHGDMTWLSKTNRCLVGVFKAYLPPWTQLPAFAVEAREEQDSSPGQRQDQGQLGGFLAVEILLGRFVAGEEYFCERDSWLDVPRNLRRFLGQQGKGTDAGVAQSWSDTQWTEFRHAIADELYRCLDSQGLMERIQQVYTAPKQCTAYSKGFAAGSHMEVARRRGSKRPWPQRLGAMQGNLHAGAIVRVLGKARTVIRGEQASDRLQLVSRFLVDFLILRRDLKLAHRVYQAMDQVRLLEEDAEAKLSRSNDSLNDFPSSAEVRRASGRRRSDEVSSASDRRRSDEVSSASDRRRSHAVLKADVRGSTRITDELLAKGLNPASHFSLNFFDPVNELLGEFNAHKVFVEGDAVIIAVYDSEQEEVGASAVARACCLARNIIHVVNLQNVFLRRHGLPELELGLGIAFSRREPHFLYDGVQEIMISGAINRADRLSSNSGVLRDADFKPSNGAFRVDVLHNATGCDKPGSGLDLLSYNVNGVKLEEQAFLKLHEEIRLIPLERPGGDFGSSRFLVGRYVETSGRSHWIQIRHAPVHEWYGERVGDIERQPQPQRRYFFEMVVDEGLSVMLRGLSKRRLPESQEETHEPGA